MDLQTMTYVVVGATFALYIGIAFWARATTTGEFYVAGKGIHPIANGMATGADWMSAASFISMAGLIACGGLGFLVLIELGRCEHGDGRCHTPTLRTRPLDVAAVTRGSRRCGS